MCQCKRGQNSSHHHQSQNTSFADSRDIINIVLILKLPTTIAHLRNKHYNHRSTPRVAREIICWKKKWRLSRLEILITRHLQSKPVAKEPAIFCFPVSPRGSPSQPEGTYGRTRRRTRWPTLRFSPELRSCEPRNLGWRQITNTSQRSLILYTQPWVNPVTTYTGYKYFKRCVQKAKQIFESDKAFDLVGSGLLAFICQTNLCKKIPW